MHDLLYILFISLANNADNLSVRVAYSIRGIKLTSSMNLWITVITFFISTAAALSGGFVLNLIDYRVCSLLSMALLTGIGVWILTEPLRGKKKKEPNSSYMDILKDPGDPDIDGSKDIDFKEATFLGVSLSINNAGGSLSAGMMGLNALLIGVFSALFSFAAIYAGNFLAGLFLKLRLGQKANTAAGIILILIGVMQLF
jgi:putative sporulation protein YtaF